MDENGRKSGPEEVARAMEAGDESRVYELMKGLGKKELGDCDAFAAELGFADFDEMVSFRTQGWGDDAPRSAMRGELRELFGMCWEDFGDADGAEPPGAVGAAVRACLLPAAFACAFVAMWLWRANPIALIGLVVAACWLVSQAVFSYRRAKFALHARELFCKHGAPRCCGGSGASRVADTPASEDEAGGDEDGEQDEGDDAEAGSGDEPQPEDAGGESRPGDGEPRDGNPGDAGEDADEPQTAPEESGDDSEAPAPNPEAAETRKVPASPVTAPPATETGKREHSMAARRDPAKLPGWHRRKHAPKPVRR